MGTYPLMHKPTKRAPLFETLQFTIIYTPGTVYFLTWMVASLLKHSPCSFRLVSNGCMVPEQRYLEHFCRRDQRLSFLSLSTDHCLPHGEILDYLQAIHTDEWFCFLDSDMFATADFLAEFTVDIPRYAAVFSGAPVWATASDQILPENFKIISGHHTDSDRQHCLGCTYFAVYNNALLGELRSRTGLSFKTAYWNDIAEQHQQKLIALGLKKKFYDTARLLNLMLVYEGHALCYQDLPSLTHIGGFSYIPGREFSSSLAGRIYRALSIVFHRNVLVKKLEKWRRRRSYRHLQPIDNEELEAVIAQRIEQRDPVRNYFYSLFKALPTKSPLPPLPRVKNREVDQRLRTAASAVQLLYQEYETEGQKKT